MFLFLGVGGEELSDQKALDTDIEMNIILMQHKFKRVFHYYDTNIFNNIKLQTQNWIKIGT